MKKKMRLLISTAAIAGAMGITSLAGTWDSSTGAWRYMEDTGTYSVNGWVSDGGCWYRTDENGVMRTGWYQDVNDGGRWYYLQPDVGAPQGSAKTGWLQLDGKWYFLDTRIGGPEGAMLIGWQWIDGKCYYLDPADGGAMATSKTTPDGYIVDVSGAWVDENGNQHYEEGKGISSTVRLDITGNAGPGGGSSGGTVFGGGSGGSSGGGGSSSGGSSGKTYSTSNSSWSDYKDSSVSHAANDFTTGNWGMMSADEQADVNDAINEFKEQYISSDMSDFEKEIKIIEWIVENCRYQKGDGWENATAYSCIINGEAQCAGYADAFLQTAKACGLNVRYVYNQFHAWNLIELDGDWYHVDVTWEDPVTTSGSNGYGFGKLSNEYINLEDSEIRGIIYHDEWSPKTIKANGTKYGQAVVEEYLESGDIDTSLGSSFADRVDEIFDSAGVVVNYENKEDAVDEIMAYFDEIIAKREEYFNVIVRFPTKYKDSDAGDWLYVNDLMKDLSSDVTEKLNAKYGDVLNGKYELYLFNKNDANDNIYGQDSGSIRYKKGQAKQVEYTINFIDKDTGEKVGTQTGTTDKNSSVELVFPEHYNFISSGESNCEILSGNGRNEGRRITVLGTEALEMNLNVHRNELHYKATFVDEDTEEVLGTEEGYAEYKKRTDLDFDTDAYTIRSIETSKGEVRRNGAGFIVESREDIEMTVILTKR